MYTKNSLVLTRHKNLPSFVSNTFKICPKATKTKGCLFETEFTVVIEPSKNFIKYDLFILHVFLFWIVIPDQTKTFAVLLRHRA